MKRCEGPDCGVEFEPKRSTARFCSATCRQRAGRARKAAEVAAQPAPPEPQSGAAEHTLVSTVRKELEDADALATVPGQLALQIARRIAAPDCAGVSTLSKELRALLAEAKGDQPAGPDEPAEPVVEEDELDKARRQRAEARQAAGLA